MIGALMMAALAQGGPEAPQDPGAAPEAVVRAFFEDVAEERWRAAAERYHPDMMARLRTAMLEQARAEAQRAPVDPADLYPPDMPQEVRDYFERQRAEGWQQSEPEPPPWTDPDTVEAWSGVELLAGVLEWSDPRAEMRRTMRAQGAPASMEGYADVVAQRYRVLGAVVEGERAYVVYQREPRFAPELPLSGVATAELRRHEGGWGIWSHPGPLVGGWMGHGTMVYGFGMEGLGESAPADSVFEWPREGDPALRVVREGDALRLHLTSPGGASASILLAAEALEALVEYLATQHFTRSGR